jgi:hypothetical protein
MIEGDSLYIDTNILILLGERRDERADLLTEIAAASSGIDGPFLCTPAVVDVVLPDTAVLRSILEARSNA